MRILLWGTYDTGKPRIRILRNGLREMPGVELQEIHASVWEGIEDKSQIAEFGHRIRLLSRWLLAYPRLVYRLARAPRPDVLLISYPGIIDIFIAAAIARARGIPVAWDVFLSLYDTICEDRGLIAPGSLSAKLLRALEKKALDTADLVFMDTQAHARRIERLFDLELGSCGSVWVGVETEHFGGISTSPRATTADAPMRILFYGQFIPLHGVDTIVRAARLLKNESVEWLIIGRGQVAGQIRAIIEQEPLPNLQWLEWVDYGQLKRYLSEADLCLGIFGASAKAASVIPNKVFQILAAQRPLITRDSPAIRELLSDSPPDTYLVPPDDPVALSRSVLEHLQSRKAETSPRKSLSARFDKIAVARQFLDLIGRIHSSEQKISAR